jgi:hypothetical protein
MKVKWSRFTIVNQRTPRPPKTLEWLKRAREIGTVWLHLPWSEEERERVGVSDLLFASEAKLQILISHSVTVTTYMYHPLRWEYITHLCHIIFRINSNCFSNY